MARQKTAWDKLSMNERAQFIKLGLQHGLTDLNDIKGYYNLYSNGGSVVHKFDGEQIGQNQELNRNIITTQPITLFGTNVPVEPFDVNEAEKIRMDKVYDDAWALAAGEELDTKTFNKVYEDFKQNFFNIYSTPLTQEQQAYQEYLDTPRDLYHIDFVLPFMQQYYSTLAGNNPQLQQLLNSFDWNYPQTVVNRVIKEQSQMQPDYQRMVDNVLEGLTYAESYFTSPGFQDRLRNFDQEYLYLDIPSFETILYNQEPTITFDPTYNNANANLVFGLQHANFGTAAHELAHKNMVYNSKDQYYDIKDYANDKNSLYYSPYYGFNYQQITPEILTILKPSNYTNTHDAEISESYSDLIRTRAQLEKLGIYSSTQTGQTFTEDLYDQYLNTEAGKTDRFLQLHTKQQVLDALNLIASNINTTNPFEVSNNTYLAAFGGPLTHKKSTGGPLYPFSFEKNPFLKTPVVRYDEGGHKQDASNPGGYTDEQLNKNYQIWKTYDPTGGLNFFNYIASQNSGNLARGEENEYWKEYLGLNSAVPLMNSNAYTEWDKQIEAQKTQNGELTSDFYGTTPRMDYNIQALADTLMLGNMVRNYEKYDKMYDLPHIETITQAYEQAKNILNNPNQWTFVDGEIPIGGYRYDSKTSETNPLGMLSHFGMKWVPEENALYMHDTYDFPNKVYTFTDIPVRPREMKIRSRINFDPIRGSWLLRSPVNYNTQIPVTVTK